MQVIYKIERVKDWVGVLILERLGYSWHIKHRINGKMEKVAQSYYYTKDKQKALDNLNINYNTCTGLARDLFNYKED